jgi:hypothetical protein
MPLFYLEDSQNQNSQNTATLKEALHEFIGTAYIVQKIGDGEIPMYKEMHKITDITVKNGVVYFIRGNAHRK